MKNSLFVLFFIGSVLISCKDQLSGKSVELIIQNNRFNSPIYISVPPPDRIESYQNILNNSVVIDNGFVPMVSVSVGKDFKDYDPFLISYLIKNGVADVKIADQTTTNRFGSTTETFHFVLYNPSFINTLVKFSGNIYDESEYGIRVGIRRFGSIIYQNKYEQNIGGISLQVISIRFTYFIEPQLPGLSDIRNKTFTGQADIYLNPRNGAWEINNFELNDKGESEFLEIFRNSNEKYMDTQINNSSSANTINPNNNQNTMIQDHFTPDTQLLSMDTNTVALMDTAQIAIPITDTSQ